MSAILFAAAVENGAEMPDRTADGTDFIPGSNGRPRWAESILLR